MKRTQFVSPLALSIAVWLALPVIANQRLIRFEGGIGVIPVRGGPTSNVVREVEPAGTPWVIGDLRADIREDGRIRVDGRGLLLAGGNNIGRSLSLNVKARLFCGTLAHDSATVALEANGDFRIDDVLTPLPPSPCAAPVLLIVNTAGTAWFAAGIPRE
jgi:hypothetical protein